MSLEQSTQSDNCVQKRYGTFSCSSVLWVILQNEYFLKRERKATYLEVENTVALENDGLDKEKQRMPYIRSNTTYSSWHCTIEY